MYTESDFSASPFHGGGTPAGPNRSRTPHHGSRNPERTHVVVGVMSGIRVVEVAAWTYVPVAGAILTEWGADVLKIEHPESGDPQRGDRKSVGQGKGVEEGPR